MERKKITFDSFIRGSIGCVLVVGILMLVERLSGVLLPFFIAWLIAYMVYPLVKFFQYNLRLKSRIIPHYGYRSHFILPISAADDFGNRQNERFVGDLPHQWSR